MHTLACELVGAEKAIVYSRSRFAFGNHKWHTRFAIPNMGMTFYIRFIYEYPAPKKRTCFTMLEMKMPTVKSFNETLNV